MFFRLMTFTQKVISIVSGLLLEQALWCWKNNSNIYKVMFHDVQLILTFTMSKWAIKRRLQNGLCAISSGRDCRQPCVKNTFRPYFDALSRWYMFPSRCHILVIVLNEFKLFPRSRDDGVIINTPL
jgi:hypothetical protein